MDQNSMRSYRNHYRAGLAPNEDEGVPVVVWQDMEKEMKRRMMKQAVTMYLVAKSKLDGTKKTLPNKAINDIINTLGSPSWMNRNKVYYAVRKYLACKNLHPLQTSFHHRNNEEVVVLENPVDNDNVPTSIFLSRNDDDSASILTGARDESGSSNPSMTKEDVQLFYVQNNFLCSKESWIMPLILHLKNTLKN
jgi:hypothetical protein